MKTITSVSIDEELLDKARQSQMNISGVFEGAIKDKLNFKEIEIKDKCEFCGKDEIKASKATNYIGLTWLCPDERWICNSCLRYKMGKVTVTTA